MAIGDLIQRYPLLRFFIPYVCGIGLAHVIYPYVGLSEEWDTGGVLCVSVIVLCVGLVCRKWWQSAFGMAVPLLFLTFGFGGYMLARRNICYEWPSVSALYEARVVDEPRRRTRSTLCVVEVTAVRDSSGWHEVGRRVFAYMEPCVEVDSLLPGDVLCFSGRVRAPHNFSDSLDFDYARYVTMQGVSGTVYLPRHEWHKVGEGSRSLRERMLRVRHRLYADCLHPTFGGDVLGVLSALTLGDRRALSNELRAVYSEVGAAHALALSGMHVGVIYFMLAWVLRGLFRRYALRWLGQLLVVGLLWLFVFMVGMPASAVRAVAMCTLYTLARWLSDGTSSPLHVLSLTAMLMLLVRPLYLFDVGFQLSFMAMASILWLGPYVGNFYSHCRLHPLPAYFVRVASMSVLAQLGTFPLALYHFGTFPTYFLITNLVVVPCLTLVLGMTLTWLGMVLLSIPLNGWLGSLLQYVVSGMNGCLAHISLWPGAVLRVSDYNGFAVLFTYLFILFAGLYVVKRWPRGAVLALASLLGLSLSLL